MQIKITQHWDEAHWAEHALTLTPQQQQQVIEAREAEPTLTDDEIIDILGISPYDVINDGYVLDDGFKANDDEIECIEITDDE